MRPNEKSTSMSQINFNAGQKINVEKTRSNVNPLILYQEDS